MIIDSENSERHIHMIKGTTSLAKTTRPSLSNVLARERLFTLLDQSRDSSMAWISGPPGSGKTTLVASYLNHRELDCLWYQIDKGDADIATFFYYMSQAVGGNGANVKEPLPSLSIRDESRLSKLTHKFRNFLQQVRIAAHPPQLVSYAQVQDRNKPLPLLSPEFRDGVSTFTRQYFRDLFGKLNIPFTVVFDCYEQLAVQAKFHEMITYGLDEIPPGGSVIFLSRGDPPSVLARFRANQQMALIDWNTLRLTQEESDGIVELHGHNLSNDEKLQIHDKTQGWAAGLVLMLQHTKTGGTIDETPTTFTPKVVFDYLAGEVFPSFDQTAQEFLLRTACLPQMTVDIAAQVSGNPDATSLLDDLASRYYFVTAKHTQSDPIYEYHPLFREFLLRKASGSINKEFFLGSQRKAASLLESTGQIEDAVELLVQAKDWEGLAHIVMDHASTMLNQGRSETLAHWLDEFPVEKIYGDPWLLYWSGACQIPFAPRESRRYFEKAFALFEQQERKDAKGLYVASAGVMESIVYELDDLTLLDNWIQVLENLLQIYPDDLVDETDAKVTCAFFMSLLLRRPDHPEIRTWVSHAMEVSDASRDPELQMSINWLVAISVMWDGHFKQAQNVIYLMRRLAQSPDATPLTLTTLKNVESMYYMLTGDYAQCLSAVNDGLEIANNSGVFIWNYQLLASGVGGALGAGDLETAEKLLKEMELHPEWAHRQDLCFFYYFSAWHAMLKEDPIHAYDLQRTALKYAIEVGNPFIEILCRVGFAQVLHECGDDDKAAANLRQAHAMARDIKNHFLEFMSFLSYAYLVLDYGKERTGLNALRYAMKVGREYGYKHTLWWQPKVMAKLCARALDEGIEVEYVRNLIRERQLQAHIPALSVDNWPWAFEIQTLGNFQLLKNGKSLGFFKKPKQKPMQLLKALIAFGGKQVKVERLEDTLWPHVDSDYAHQSFTTTLHRLRKKLGEDDAIILREGRLSLSDSHCWLDVWAMEQVLDEIRELLKEGITEIDENYLTKLANKLLSLYQGPFLKDETDQPSYAATQDRFRNRFIRAVTRVGHYWEQSNQRDKAIDLYQQAIELDDVTEGVYCSLVLCLKHLDRTAEAVEVYHQCSTALARLNIEPSPATQEIYKSLVN